VLRRTIDKWLKAGVMEDGAVSYPDSGSPQGGVVSPLLANVYLHEVLDVWFEKQVRPRLAGRAALIRFADDAVLLFASEADARRVMAVLPKRFGNYGLTLHPEKTRLVPFRRPSSSGGGKRGDRPGTFDLLGFTHYWGRSLRGFMVIKRQTARSRLQRALKKVALWCRAHRHEPVDEQSLGGEIPRGDPTSARLRFWRPTGAPASGRATPCRSTCPTRSRAGSPRRA
jgi:RNA-directed DNA polymerase